MEHPPLAVFVNGKFYLTPLRPCLVQLFLASACQKSEAEPNGLADKLAFEKLKGWLLRK
uniref:Uncharacterized protein n=1 Tax=Arundo donax TaxID=35708 RepID=A0A0A9D9V0_ARUDO